MRRSSLASDVDLPGNARAFGHACVPGNACVPGVAECEVLG